VADYRRGIPVLIVTLIMPVCASAQERHYTRVYNAGANVSIMGITIFSRSGVGGGFASLDDGGTPDDRQIRLRFLSGSAPERAHGLNRLGFIEERIEEKTQSPTAIDYFGFITANKEGSIIQARSALNSAAKDSALYTAAEGSSRGREVEYNVHDMFLPARCRWADAAELLAKTAATFTPGTQTRKMTIASPDGETVDTFLYTVVRAIQSSATAANSRFLYNGKLYRLHWEKTDDERTGAEFAESGVVASAETVVRLKGTMHRDGSIDDTVFRLWFDRVSANPLPLRFEFWPRPYLKLVFDAQPASPSSGARATWAAALPSIPLANSFFDSGR
jgi:hypothetical protein